MGSIAANLTHGEYEVRWLRSLGRKEAAAWQKPRDSQRARLYRAEHRTALRLVEPNLGSVDEVQGLVDRVVGSDWWRSAAPHRPMVAVADGRGRRSGGSVGGEIRLPRMYRNRLIVLHELAHEWIMCPVRAPHGPDFAAGFLMLAGEFHGGRTRDLLAASFEAERVEVSDRFGG
jgi:putative metallohydrolase (TIGR04338 family)